MLRATAATLKIVAASTRLWRRMVWRLSSAVALGEPRRGHLESSDGWDNRLASGPQPTTFSLSRAAPPQPHKPPRTAWGEIHRPQGPARPCLHHRFRHDRQGWHKQKQKQKQRNKGHNRFDNVLRRCALKMCAGFVRRQTVGNTYSSHSLRTIDAKDDLTRAHLGSRSAVVFSDSCQSNIYRLKRKLESNV